MRKLLLALLLVLCLSMSVFADRKIIIEGGVIKRVSTQEVSMDTLKQQYKSLLSRKQNAADALLKAQDDIQAFKDMLTKAGIDFKDW